MRMSASISTADRRCRCTTARRGSPAPGGARCGLRVCRASHVFPLRWRPAADRAAPRRSGQPAHALAAVLMAAGSLRCSATASSRRARCSVSAWCSRSSSRFSISMVETSRPFDAGGAAAGPVGARSLDRVRRRIHSKPPDRHARRRARRGDDLAAGLLDQRRRASDFVTESWRQTSVWPVMNYLMAVLAYLVGRRTYGTACQAPDRGGARQLSPRCADRRRRDGRGLAGEPPDARAPGGDQAGEARRRAGRRLFMQRFRREANVIAGLQSPHTVYLYDFGTAQDGRFYYVMELLDGISLQTLVTTFGPQPASRVVVILRQICRSLEEAHEQRIVHRDLKPSNVMICQVAQALRLREGARLRARQAVRHRVDVSHLTVEGVTPGTPGYIAPEVARASPDVDARADLYALGCVAYVLLTGTLVFPDPNPLSMALKHVQDPAGSAVAADRAADSARSRAHHPAMPRERTRRTVPVSARDARRDARRVRRAAMDRARRRRLVGAPPAADVVRCAHSHRRRRTRRRSSRKPDYEHVRAAHARHASRAAFTPVAFRSSRRSASPRRARSSGCCRCSRTSGPAKAWARCSSPSTSSCCWRATR